MGRLMVSVAVRFHNVRQMFVYYVPMDQLWMESSDNSTPLSEYDEDNLIALICKREDVKLD